MFQSGPGFSKSPPHPRSPSKYTYTASRSVPVNSSQQGLLTNGSPQSFANTPKNFSRSNTHLVGTQRRNKRVNDYEQHHMLIPHASSFSVHEDTPPAHGKKIYHKGGQKLVHHCSHMIPVYNVQLYRYHYVISGYSLYYTM